VTLGLLDYLSTRALLPGRDRDVDFLPPISVLRAEHRIASTCLFDAMAAGGHTSGDAVTGVTVSFTIVAVICTALRLYTRFALNKMGGVDDVFIAIATVCSPRQQSRPVLIRCIDLVSGAHNYNVRSRYVSLCVDELPKRAQTNVWQLNMAWEATHRHSLHTTSCGPTDGSGRAYGSITLPFTSLRWPYYCNTSAFSHRKHSAE
jgi:hypothetical protein